MDPVNRRPGSPGLEEDMTNPFRYTIAVAAVLLAMLVAAPACQCESEEPKKPTKHDIAVALDDDDAQYRWKPIETITVQSGDTIRFTVKEHTAWILIPDDRFRLLDGGSDWVASKSYTAFKVENGSAVIRLDECATGAEPEEEMHYSVLVRQVNGKWDYVHGKNPPPRMVLPPRK